MQTGKLIAPRFGQPRVELGGGARATDSARAPADLHNVVPFMRPRAATHAPEIALPADTHLPDTAVAHDRLRLMAFAVLSLAVHAGLFAASWRDPVPLASIGEQVISLEIVVGASAPAGVAQAPGENEVQAAAAPEPREPEPPREPEQLATVQPQDVPVAPEETAPEQTAKSETPVENIVTETTKPKEEKPPEAQQPKQAQPPPEEKKTEKAQQPKPAQNTAPAKERRRIEAPTKEQATKQAKASVPSAAANNVGVGRSDADSNYAGLVSAHLRRHQQYPPDARSRGDQGTATVSFSLDGGGRVISSNLARGSGIASIDQEVQAMVRRSSPFPAPPSGRGVSFTVPVSFRLH